MNESQCPCKSGAPYADCCKLIHESHALADHPEKLMRSRYSAHALKLVDFVINTYHPECMAQQQRDHIAESVALRWCDLVVISSSIDLNNQDQGFVEFRAQYIEEGALYTMQEKSRFVRENALWYYLDGTFDEQNQSEPIKIKRNDPCPCRSGQKFKKCCS